MLCVWCPLALAPACPPMSPPPPRCCVSRACCPIRVSLPPTCVGGADLRLCTRLAGGWSRGVGRPLCPRVQSRGLLWAHSMVADCPPSCSVLALECGQPWLGEEGGLAGPPFPTCLGSTAWPGHAGPAEGTATGQGKTRDGGQGQGHVCGGAAECLSVKMTGLSLREGADVCGGRGLQPSLEAEGQRDPYGSATGRGQAQEETGPGGGSDTAPCGQGAPEPGGRRVEGLGLSRLMAEWGVAVGAAGLGGRDLEAGSLGPPQDPPGPADPLPWCEGQASVLHRGSIWTCLVAGGGHGLRRPLGCGSSGEQGPGAEPGPLSGVPGPLPVQAASLQPNRASLPP